MRQLLVVSSFLALLSGCQSIRETFDHEAHQLRLAGRFKNKIYVGVRSDFKVMADPYYLSHIFTSLIDLPFSLISDTMLLPYTIPVTIDNLSEKNVIDPVCFLLEDIDHDLLSKEGKPRPDVFKESNPCRTASPWGEDRWVAQQASIPIARLESVASFYEAVMPLAKMSQVPPLLLSATHVTYRCHTTGLEDMYITLVLQPAERRIYEPFLLWAANDEQAKALKALIPKVGGAITRENFSLAEYWPDLEAFYFTDPVGTRFQVLYRAKGPSARWVDKKTD